MSRQVVVQLALVLSLLSTNLLVTHSTANADERALTASTGSEAVLSIDARAGWQATGVIVEPGMPVMIEVIDGQWTFGIEEIPYTGGEGGDYACAEVADASTCPEPLPEAPIGALVGRIWGTVFLVGNGATFESSEAGELELAINDNPETLSNNDGVLTVRIVVEQSGDPAVEATEPDNSVNPRTETPSEAEVEEFVDRSLDLAQMEADGLIKGGDDGFVTFDTVTAEQQGFSPESIRLADEMAAFTNELVAEASSGNEIANTTLPEMQSFRQPLEGAEVLVLQDDEIPAEEVEGSYPDVGGSVDTDQYPMLEEYFQDAVAAEQAVVNDLEGSRSFIGAANLELALISQPHAVCGSFSNPLPRTAAPYLPHPSNDPAGELRARGFHETEWPGGRGWTKAWSYQPSICGERTFRDHAGLDGPNSYVEQNYKGYTPNGEPNPEFWWWSPSNPSKWPYWNWPAYVKWWHDNH